MQIRNREKSKRVGQCLNCKLPVYQDEDRICVSVMTQQSKVDDRMYFCHRTECWNTVSNFVNRVDGTESEEALLKEEQEDYGHEL